MYDTSPPDTKIRLIFYGLLLIVFVGAIIMRRFSLWQYVYGRSKADQDNANSPDDSKLLSFYTAGHNLFNAGRVKFDDITATAYITEAGADLDKSAYVTDPACIYSLELPFNTQAHIIGLPKQFGVDRLQFEMFLKAGSMEKVVLEGNFSDYFDLYTAPNQGMEVREVMNPESMAYVVDYCSAHFWEINDSQLYLVVNLADRDTSKVSNALAQSQQFALQLKPALMPGQPGAAPVHHESAYGVYDGPALACPICSKTMTLTDNWQLCPDNHGMLISARALSQVSAKTLALPEVTGVSVRHGLITCPNCQKQMETVPYEAGGLVIDVCSNCLFRWLDVDEVNSIRTGKLLRPTEEIIT